jgi:hypothetical protein
MLGGRVGPLSPTGVGAARPNLAARASLTPPLPRNALVLVCDLLGHSRVTITAAVYSHMLAAHQEPVAAEMEYLYGTAAREGAE